MGVYTNEMKMTTHNTHEGRRGHAIGDYGEVLILRCKNETCGLSVVGFGTPARAFYKLVLVRESAFPCIWRSTVSATVASQLSDCIYNTIKKTKKQLLAPPRFVAG